MAGQKAIGIVGCHLLEDEMVHVIGRDRDVKTVYLVDNGVSDTMLSKLRSLSPEREVFTVPEESVADLKVERPGTVIIWQKPIVLHILPWELRDDVLSSVKLIEPICDVVMLFYGLCGNAFRNIEATVRDVKVPVTILRDGKGEIVDDCIGTALGGCEEYLNILRTNSGTFYLTPMWALNWRRFFADIRVIQNEGDLEGAKYVFDFMGYKKVLKISTGLNDGQMFDRSVREFADIFSFKVGDVPSGTSVVESSYLKAKALHTMQ